MISFLYTLNITSYIKYRVTREFASAMRGRYLHEFTRFFPNPPELFLNPRYEFSDSAQFSNVFYSILINVYNL